MNLLNFKKVDLVFQGIEKVLISLLLVVMFVCGLLQVYSRFILKSPISWSEELLTYLFSWTCFLGTSLAISTKSHFFVDLFVARIPQKMSRYIEFFVYIILFLFSFFLIIYGIEATIAARIQQMNILPLSLFWGYIILPISGFFIAFHALCHALDILVSIRKI